MAELSLYRQSFVAQAATVQSDHLRAHGCSMKTRRCGSSHILGWRLHDPGALSRMRVRMPSGLYYMTPCATETRNKDESGTRRPCLLSSLSTSSGMAMSAFSLNLSDQERQVGGKLATARRSVLPQGYNCSCHPAVLQSFMAALSLTPKCSAAVRRD